MLTIFWYDPDGKLHTDLKSDRIAPLLAEGKGLLWVAAERPTADETHLLTRTFHLHPLVVEDLIHQNQYPKVEEFGGNLFMVAHAPKPDPEHGRFESCEAEFWCTPTALFTHHIDPIPAIAGSLRRARDDAETWFGRGAAALMYRVLDQMIDNYRPLLLKMEERVSDLDEEVLRRPTTRTQARLTGVKRDILRLRRIAVPSREVFARLAHTHHPLISTDVRPYYGDLYDHLMRAVLETETHRETVAGLRDTYLANISLRTNEVMKLLAMVTAMMLPINILAGIYGMNFKEIPLAEHEWGFWIMVVLMLGLAGTVAWFFRRKHLL